MTIEQPKPIPVEKGWPLLGVLPNLLSGNPYEYLKSVMLEQGDFVKLNVASQPVYLVSHPDYLQRILRDNYQNYRKPDMMYKVSREVSGNGLINSDGKFWLRQRRMIQPHLHRKELEYLFEDMVDATLEVLNRWELLAKNQTEIELGDKIGEITMNVITHTMFGKGILSAEEIAEIGIRISKMIKYIGETLYSSIVPKWFPIPGKREFTQNLNEVRKTINKIIAKCREDKDSSASLIKMLLNSVDEETHEQMTEQQLFDEVLTIFVAGYETTATTIAWLGVIIEKHPDVLEKLQAESDQILAGRTPSFEDIPRLTYTRKVFMETLRMYAVAPFLPRALNKEDQLGLYHLPSEALVLVFYHGVHHNPRVWENPEAFDPERFTSERMAEQNQFAYVPFSAGPRKCAGDEFALLEAPLIIAMMLQKYNLTIIPGQTFTAKIGGTMKPKNGVKAIFSKRNFV